MSAPMAARDDPTSRPASIGEPACPVVAIGASAGGLDALRRLLDGLASDTGRAFVIVQHLDPSQDSLLAGLLAGHTAMPVAEAKNGATVEPDHVYLIAPGTTLTVAGGRIAVTPARAVRGIRSPIDALFASLAAWPGQATAIILSGTGADGSGTLTALHEAGALILAQDPAEAAFPAMPAAAIATGLVHGVHPLADLPTAIGVRPARVAANPAAAPAGAPWPMPVIELLRANTTHDFRLYKPGTLERGIERRMGLAGIDRAARDRYLRLLETDAGERDGLARDLLINVTAFFRDPEVFDALERTVIPDIVARHPGGQALRLWVAGCSTGEEAYSLAMLFQEAIAAAGSPARLQVFASDVDPDAIETARAGFYSSEAAAGVSAARLATFFAPEDGGHRVLPVLRQAIVFTVHDVLADPPFSRLDMVSCRNLLIYLGPEAQARVISLLHFALNEGGVLLLGRAETAGDVAGRFEAVAGTPSLHRHIGRHRPGGFSAPAAPAAPRFVAPPAGGPATRQAAHAELCRRLVLAHHAPAAVLVDAGLQLLFALGPIERYLRVPAGQPTTDVAAMLPPASRAALRRAVAEAAGRRAPVFVDGSRLAGPDADYRIVVHAAPAPEPLFLLRFEDAAHASPAAPAPADAAHAVHARELAAVQAELDDAVAEVERLSDERRSAAEEASSVGEEHQSTNEELLTSKEELQSLNEELTALNGQLRETLDAQRTAANDLQNVLYSTDVATLFLDRDLRIRFFTPATKALFSIIAADIGRPLADLRSLADDTLLAADAATVLAGHPAIDREIAADAGRWCRTVLPYRAQDGRVEGVVITFADVTERKRAAAELESARREAERANAAKSRFLAAASHDLRQPLQTLTLLQGLLAGAVEGERGQRLVSRLDETLGAMSGMLNTLLDINQIEAGAVRAAPEAFAIGPLLGRLRDEFTYVAEAKGVRLRVLGSGHHVASDPRLLEQMLRNLLSNALKYTPEGRVLFGCRRRGDALAIEVWDTGIGIPPAELDAIFAEYHQLDNPARERGRGLGLGLSIVRRLGDLLGHPVRVRSRPSRGSVFWVEVPLAEARTPSADSALEQSLPSARILLAENDPEVRELLAMALADAGHEVAAAHDGAEALALATGAALRPDLLLTDYNLPGGLNGLDLVARLRAAFGAALPVIVLTADISTAALGDIARHDCRRLSKPVKIDELLSAIAEALANHSAPSPSGGRTGERVAVVDDDPSVRHALADLLVAKGLDVRAHASGEGFLANGAADCGCVLLDAYMPGASGLDVLRRMRADGHVAPVIVMTGGGDIGMAVEAMRAGAMDFLVKPVTADELLEAVDRALEFGRDALSLGRWRADAAARVATLTTRQREIMTLVLAGHPSKNIAADLAISQRTVENHRAEIMSRTGARSLPALARLALAADAA